MIERSRNMRKVFDAAVKGLSALAAALSLGMLVWILSTVIGRGVKAINWAFFTQLPTPPGVGGGGLVNAMIGTMVMIALAAIAAVPVGVAAGTYLVEFGRGGAVARAVQAVNNVLMGVPSIVVGVFIYIIMVKPMGKFSGLAGAVSLGVLMFPVVVRTTADMLQMVPDHLRESALALGASHRRMVLDIVFRAARLGLLTGVLLAVARISGETAPLLFTALNSPFWFHSLTEPMPNLTVTIFNYAMSPYEDWQAKAWGASLTIMVGVFASMVAARLILKGKRAL